MTPAGAEDLEFARLWLPLKGISSGVNDTAGAKIGDFIVEYLHKFEAICKKALTR
jgi:hypothetical protein